MLTIEVSRACPLASISPSWDLVNIFRGRITSVHVEVAPIAVVEHASLRRPNQMMRKLESWLLCCAMSAACSGSGGGSQMAATAPETLVGEIQLTGSAPAFLVTLTTAEGRSVDLIGDLRGELQNLSGAEIAVRGTPASARDFDVVSYEIRAIQGVRPLVGTLAYRDGEYWLDAEESVRLVTPSEGLRAQVGAKVWILGRAVADGVHPQTYGVIRASRE